MKTNERIAGNPWLKDKVKELGQVMTPDYIVDMILDDIGYTGDNILNKKIMEPSFGKYVENRYRGHTFLVVKKLKDASLYLIGIVWIGTKRYR